MKILFLAPHPFYQERGTPIAADLLLKVLAERGDTVDVVTYHEGSDVSHGDRVAIHRIGKPPGISGIRPGFSFKKLVCDWSMLRKVLAMTRKRKYDVVHAVEESVFMAMLVRRRRGIPYIYDMDSSMSRQIVERCRCMSLLAPLMKNMEARAIRGARSVVTMCDSLADLARSQGARETVVLRDISLLTDDVPRPREEVRRELGITGTCFMYIGNLEKYQGIDLLLEGYALAADRVPDAMLTVVGGAQMHIDKYRKKASEMRKEDRIRFAGARPLTMMKSLFGAADVLVSPRIKGDNTPMKLYSYLDSGKPIIATDIASHTQVLTTDTALLTAPEPAAVANAMVRLAGDPGLRRQLADKALAEARGKYHFGAFRKTVLDLYAQLDGAERAEG
jgi:glycosyltransferase involved in cell wall biosynthesis